MSVWPVSSSMRRVWATSSSRHISPLTTVMPRVSTLGDCRNIRMDCWSVVAAPRASWSMITLRLVCAVAALVNTQASATAAMLGKILFRPMVMIDPLVFFAAENSWRLVSLGCVPAQDTCGTNGAYSSLVVVSQGKTVDSEVEWLCQRWSRELTSIADVIIRGCLCNLEKRGNLALCCSWA